MTRSGAAAAGAVSEFVCGEYANPSMRDSTMSCAVCLCTNLYLFTTIVYCWCCWCMLFMRWAGCGDRGQSASSTVGGGGRVPRHHAQQASSKHTMYRQMAPSTPSTSSGLRSMFLADSCRYGESMASSCAMDDRNAMAIRQNTTQTLAPVGME